METQNKITRAIRTASAEELFTLAETLFIDLQMSRRSETSEGAALEMTVGEIAEYLFLMARDETDGADETPEPETEDDQTGETDG